MLETFHTLPKATEVLPWTIVVKDVIRRDTQTRAARHVHTLLDPTAEYGFKEPVLGYRFGSHLGRRHG